MTAQTLEHALSGLISRLEPAARRQLARTLATTLKRNQQNRIAAQLNPDGTAFAPRKPQLRQKKGQLRRTLFPKLRTGRYLKTKHDANTAVVTFLGKVQRIAAIHHYGLRDRVMPSRKQVTYPSRELLGFAPHDIDVIEDTVLSFLKR